ncbi:hypothetical protein RRG08_066680 [Elysia crispata]|uniref:Uncharacterized protein n=1 Tax=Elysia crispata TaxID=231223 RepID=A0AAE1DPM5_9GAST|nr:hypothetical protein RRG08_066680 [Elysia crispata]
MGRGPWPTCGTCHSSPGRRTGVGAEARRRPGTDSPGPGHLLKPSTIRGKPESFLTTRLVESIFNTVPKVDVMLAFNSAKRVLQSATHTDSSQRAEGTRLYSGTSFAAVCAGNWAENFSITVW